MLDPKNRPGWGASAEAFDSISDLLEEVLNIVEEMETHSLQIPAFDEHEPFASLREGLDETCKSINTILGGYK